MWVSLRRFLAANALTAAFVLGLEVLGFEISLNREQNKPV